MAKFMWFILAWEAFWRNPKDRIPCCHLPSGHHTGPLYEEGLDIPLRSLCIDVVLIDYPQQYTSIRYPL